MKYIVYFGDDWIEVFELKQGEDLFEKLKKDVFVIHRLFEEITCKKYTEDAQRVTCVEESPDASVEIVIEIKKEALEQFIRDLNPAEVHQLDKIIPRSGGEYVFWLKISETVKNKSGRIIRKSEEELIHEFAVLCESYNPEAFNSS